MNQVAMTKRMRLKIAMVRRHLSVEQVADLTGRTIRTVYSWTGGEREVPDHILLLIEGEQANG